MKTYLPLTLIALLIPSYASTSILPKSAADVDFESREGKTGWAKHEHVEIFRDHSTSGAYDATKVGLGDSGSDLRAADITKITVIREHGITLHDWNIIAGIYFKSVQTGTKVKITTESSKDIGVSGDVTPDGWAGKPLKGMRRHLNDTHQVARKVNRSDFE